MSETFHRLYRTRLARGEWRDRPRPVLINNWEGTYFDFDEERLVAIATVAHELGTELFVLDDGWFGRRDSDDRSLGDWVVDTRKLPNGLAGLAARITALGMRFGVWIEPEMVNADSDLYPSASGLGHRGPGLPHTESRQQLVLDLGRQEVLDHLTDALTAVLASAPIDYVKWDMNRTMTETFARDLPPERQGEMRFRYILGVYELYRRLTERFPHILFESCSSGGGRFDAGMLAFAPQAWTSDDTDALERVRIQWGTSLVFPADLHGRPRLGRAQPSERRASRRSRRAPAWRSSVPSATSSTRPRWHPRSGWRWRPRWPGSKRIGRPSSSVGSCGCRRRSRATATTPPGCASTDDAPPRGGGLVSRLCPGLSRVREAVRLRGLDPPRDIG